MNIRIYPREFLLENIPTGLFEAIGKQVTYPSINIYSDALSIKKGDDTYEFHARENERENISNIVVYKADYEKFSEQDLKNIHRVVSVASAELALILDPTTEAALSALSPESSLTNTVRTKFLDLGVVMPTYRTAKLAERLTA